MNAKVNPNMILTEEFAKRMKNVSEKSKPFGNSTPADEVYELIAKANRDLVKQAKNYD